jgi:valyl-tRNA synthetase
MDESYNHLEAEPQMAQRWGEKADFIAPIEIGKKPFSMILWPPNASGPMHIGNSLMVAIQDCLARYHRAKGDPTLWIPSVDHGGYETQVTFEKELEKSGKSKTDFTREELYNAIDEYVKTNGTHIREQLYALGASVDWSRFRFTLDKEALASTNQMFKKMVDDKLVYRRPYMVHYCPSCGTMLSDIELNEQKRPSPLYYVKFPFTEGGGELILEVEQPEFLFATTHLLVHPSDARFSSHIGKKLTNPSTGKYIDIVASKRKFDPANPEPLKPFSPSSDKYDYTYTLRNDIPSKNLLDWQGVLIDQYPGLTPDEARIKEVEKLASTGSIERIDDSHEEDVYLCKRGHITQNLIIQSWFLKLNDPEISLSKQALNAISKEGLIVVPKWREKGIVEWLTKMPDWPISRQNVWGVRIPVWYEVTSDPSLFMVWFRNKDKELHYGNLKLFLDQGISLEEISSGLERIYASEGAVWVLEKENDKDYLQETDSFDTWFSSGDWSAMAFGSQDSEDFKYFYPSHSLIIGQDLIRLSVCREIFLSVYVTGRLPFKIVYLHRLIKGKDGQKMSKSLGNAVTLETYLNKYGADALRMALVSYTMESEDFILEESRLEFFRELCYRLWTVGRVVYLANEFNVQESHGEASSHEEREIIKKLGFLIRDTENKLDRYFFANAQERLVDFVTALEEFVAFMQTKHDFTSQLSTLKYVFYKFLVTAHPFMPFVTEKLNSELYKDKNLLAKQSWPKL